jgi:vacuolar-type H+-ATPase subunit I/STV1
MAEGNGSGRLDRIEAILDKMGERLDQVATMGYLHDERLSRIEAAIEQMQGAEAEYRNEQREREKRIDERIGTLVSSIGELIGHLPRPS